MAAHSLGRCLVRANFFLALHYKVFTAGKVTFYMLKISWGTYLFHFVREWLSVYAYTTRAVLTYPAGYIVRRRKQNIPVSDSDLLWFFPAL